MPPVRSINGRAGKACDTCRRSKTRCHPCGSSSLTCLRCQTLNLECSLRVASSGPLTRVPPPHNLTAPDGSALEKRVADLERAVQRLNSIGDVDSTAVSGEATVPVESPLTVIQNAASETPASYRARAQRDAAMDIVEKGLISAIDANQLLTTFSRHYRRWITFREAEDLRLTVEQIDSPLLLCVCCLIAVRHSTAPSAQDAAAELYGEAKSLLEKQLLVAPQPLEFFQSVLLLSLWSTTIGHRPLSVDGWLITGFALQHRFATSVFKAGHLVDHHDPSRTNDTGPHLLIIRLCLSHLHSSVSMRRRSMLSRVEIEAFADAVPLDDLTNFEARMVAELDLYWKIYENCVATRVDLPRAQVALQVWKQKWETVLAQPRSQFLQMGAQFAQLLMYEQSLHHRSAAVRESLLTEMVMLSAGILRLAMTTADDRTKHLTDHIYHIITFAAITLCRLAGKYGPQLACLQSSVDVDHLLIQTITWLQDVGTPLHVGNLMSGIISTIYSRLRPEAHPNPPPRPSSNIGVRDESAYVDLFGTHNVECDWDAILSEWQLFSSGTEGGTL